jgi:signal transduction histidine kinase
VLLVAAMALIIGGATFGSLLIVRHRMLVSVTDDLAEDLARSVVTFKNLQVQRQNALERENALLADLPSLKALMTTSDWRTIEDGGIEFWKVSGADLFALANNEGQVVAAYAHGQRVDAELRSNLGSILTVPAVRFLVSGNSLYACSVRPLYFGRTVDGTLLGYVVSGFVIDRAIVSQISQATDVQAAFISGGRIVASTLPPSASSDLTAKFVRVSQPRTAPSLVDVGNVRYLASTEDLSTGSSSPLQLAVLKSFDQAERSIRDIDRLMLFAGLLALIFGTVLMLALSKVVTEPLEDLAAGVRAFGVGDSGHLLPNRGTLEVRELSVAFDGMRREILMANKALLEAERLATIGRMASSVSHDLRHYLAAVYANAEFLATSEFSEQERMDILSDIQVAVHGTTELIESMLVFSRTGTAIRRSHELMATLVERAVILIRSHPDAASVTLVAQYGDPSETAAVLDGKQIERAIYNLLLNACQSARPAGREARVTATLKLEETRIILEVLDNGVGVPENIRSSLFEPFVSEGKQKGTGLGLTLARCIAVEHGGEVTLVTSRPGETVFHLSVARGPVAQVAVESKNQKRVVAG